MIVDFASTLLAPPSFLRVVAVVVFAALAHLPTPCTSTSDAYRSGNKNTKPNIIVVQPDDFPFFESWSPPPLPPNYGGPESENAVYPAKYGLPNIERLREGGLQMLQAYTASPMCGTSRFSTITGRYPSRSGFGRYHHDPEHDSRYIRNTIVPSTKLEDKRGQPRDCTKDNLAVTFQKNGYATAMIGKFFICVKAPFLVEKRMGRNTIALCCDFSCGDTYSSLNQTIFCAHDFKKTGKWHLSAIDAKSYKYEDSVDVVKACGFDAVGALYVENMLNDDGGWYSSSDASFSHNMEWLTHDAIEFIKDSVKKVSREFPKLRPWDDQREAFCAVLLIGGERRRKGS